MNPYEVLGIEEGAEKAQIKRAYFRLLREHSPEQDPEGFAQIREAYEQLTNAEEGAGAPSLPLPNHPYAKLFAQQIENSLKEGRRKLAKETAQEAWERFPDSLFFLYEMAYTQRICGNTGKAVKNASLLVEKEPENRWFWRELALASYERGYIRKAWPAFVKAYELGCRDFHFIMMFSLECRDYEDYEMGKQILIPLTDPERRWSADDMEDALEAYLALFTMICDLGESGEEEARKYIQFLEKNARSLVSHIPGCVELMGAMILRGKLPADIIRCGIRAIEKINERDPDSSKKEQNRHYMGLLGLARIHSVCHDRLPALHDTGKGKNLRGGGISQGRIPGLLLQSETLPGPDPLAAGCREDAVSSAAGLPETVGVLRGGQLSDVVPGKKRRSIWQAGETFGGTLCQGWQKDQPQ